MPETGQIFYEQGFANFHLHPPTEVHFKNDDRAPLLIVGAHESKTVPASLARKQYEKYEKAAAQTDYIEFEAPAPGDGRRRLGRGRGRDPEPGSSACWPTRQRQHTN